MSLLAFSLVVSAAFIHATWNFLLKRVGGGAEVVWLFSAIASIFYLPLIIWIFVTDDQALTWTHLGFFFGSAVLHLIYFTLLQRGYRVGDLSLVYPIARSTGPLLSASFAVLILGEKLSVQSAIGGLIIIGGILFLTGGFRQKAKHVLSSLGYGLAVGFFIGTYTVWDAYAVASVMVSPILLDYFGNLVRGVIVSPLAWRRRESLLVTWNNHKVAITVIGVISPVAYVLVLYAMTFTPVIYVAPLRETSVLFGVLAGSLLLGEGHLKERLICGLIILSGMGLLVTG